MKGSSSRDVQAFEVPGDLPQVSSTVVRRHRKRQTVRGRKRILFLTACPASQAPLRLGEEANAVARELRMAPYRDEFELHSRSSVDVDELMRGLMEVEPTIVHFSGHGSAQGIVVADASESSRTVSPRALAMVVGACAPKARLVVLNACHTSEHARALTVIVDCVIGMAGAISDDAARAFSVRFYSALACGVSVRAALDVGVAALVVRGLPDELLPRCVTREGINAEEIVLVRRARRPTGPRSRS